MQKALSIACVSYSDREADGNSTIKWESMAQISRLSQLRSVCWAAITGSLTALLSLLAGVAHADTSGLASRVPSVGAKAFSPSDVTTGESAFKYEIRDDLKLNPYDWNLNAASCNSNDSRGYAPISANSTEFSVLTTNVLPDSCFNLNFDGSTVKPFDIP